MSVLMQNTSLATLMTYQVAWYIILREILLETCSATDYPYFGSVYSIFAKKSKRKTIYDTCELHTNIY